VSRRTSAAEPFAQMLQIRDALAPITLIVGVRLARAIWALGWLIRVSIAPVGD